MDWIDLGVPTPRKGWKPNVQAPWPSGRREVLPKGLEGPEVTLRDVFANRRSRREFKPLALESLSQLLVLACKVHFSICDTTQSSRPAPSAGALHPIHVLLHRPGDELWNCYDPFEHALVDVASQISPIAVREDLGAIMPGDDATLLLFAAEPSGTFAKYEHACSLVWRDAGILQGYFSMAAEALGLHFCLLGVTGEPWVSRLVCEKALFGVGAAYVGASFDRQSAEPLHSDKR
jgi:hypothetical protein